ncbi:thioredoxin family protein [Thermomonospora umbrina]|uniref:Thiol-disulfide isomerase/thioredoxin n=1 Tax=Thermomonospora umbrina TaxID=111806 RepID=A0A3D9SKY8_9ACTN|nr:thioredoxin family protein [Thermomonospora umbrina]REE96592.1 thiol-disulfide isomerase/thioredoxin [Thermomonospora umbrina]
MEGALVAAGVLLAATVFGLVRRHRDGRLRAVREVEDAVPERLGPEELGVGLGERATLVQFSTAFCAPCRTTRRVLEDVAGMVEGVAHVEIDAEARLDLVRRLNVVRTPTVLVLDTAGRVVRRASGAPRKADVIAALGAAID